ncbi:MAG TPA: zf-HC2 domain-containing protein [Candidatus Limiplasma sp.]|nr:zf-HC2 domain-containing protein [Candidatus Limiplasma sp.]HRX07871.1 zf-HC2 domain-containing protein [Candidatus Limiplasma sp.]
MDKNCSIARDLMPQVIDQVASEASTAFVTDHTAGCEPCAQVFADMRGDIQGAQAQGDGMPIPFQSAISQLKKTMVWKRTRIAIIAALITAGVFLLGSTCYFFLFVEGGHALPNEDYELHLFQSENKSVYVIPKFLKTISSHGVSSSFDDETGIIYVHWMSALIPTGQDIAPRWYPDYIMRFTLTDDNTLVYGDDFIVQEVRQGNKDNYVVAYRAGDAIPLMPPAIDDYIQNQDAYRAQMDAASEAMDEAVALSFEAQSVYQKFINEWEKEQFETTAP